MKIFISRLFYFSIPIIIFLITSLSFYLYLDPFKVVKKYDSFYNSAELGRVGLNRDYVSTMTFINNYPKYKYNSFIFGNSRSIFYRVNDWNKLLSQNDRCFHFDASGESLWGIEKKLLYLKNRKVRIKNALIFFDYSTLIQVSEKNGHLFLISPPLVDNKNLYEFQSTYYRTFLTPKFLIAYLDYKLTKNIKSYMLVSKVLDDRPMDYFVESNEIQYNHFEKLISMNKYYTKERMSVFYTRDSIQKELPVCIKEKQINLLNNIKDVLVLNKTSYKVIINPLYDQKKLNSSDLNYLQDIFGKENVFDFSGKNKFTHDYRNYYENSHYRPNVAKNILDSVYQKGSTKAQLAN